MGIMNSKDFRRKVDESTSNSSLSNLRYVITEKPKWKVFKKKEVVPIPPYRPAKACPCGNDGPCKQKVTPKGVTIHYPQKKRKFGIDRRYKPPKIKKSHFSRFAWKVLSSALPSQTRIQANIRLRIPLMNFDKITNAFKSLNMIKNTSLASINFNKIGNAIKSIKLKKKPKRSLSQDFMFMPFMPPFK